MSRRPPQLLWPSHVRLGPSRARSFFVARSRFPASGQCLSWFSTSGTQKSAAFIIIPLDRLSEHFRGRNALGCARGRTSKLVRRAATQLNANSKSSPSRWGCFMKRFSALRAESRSYSLPLQHIACRLPIRLNRRSPSPTLSVALRACPRAALLSLRSIC